MSQEQLKMTHENLKIGDDMIPYLDRISVDKSSKKSHRMPKILFSERFCPQIILSVEILSDKVP